MRDFRTLKVWQKAHQLTLDIYHATRDFPAEERYGLASQIRRACASIPANIAEGCGRSGHAELNHFMHIAMGSASELEYYLLLTHDLGLLPEATYHTLANDLGEVKRMLNAFIQTLTSNR